MKGIKRLKWSKKTQVTCLVLFGVIIVVLFVTVPSLARYNHRVATDSISVWNGEVATSYREGSGSQEDPYVIANGSELAYLAQMLETTDYADTYFVLKNDIVLNEGVFQYDETGHLQYLLNGVSYYVKEYTEELYLDADYTEKANVTLQAFPAMNQFKGHLEGDLYKIYGLYVTEENADALGFFKDLQGEVSNLLFDNALVYGGSITGGVAAVATDAELKNVSFEGIVQGGDSTPLTEAISLEDQTVSNSGLELTIPLDLSLVPSQVSSITLTGTVASGNFAEISIQGQALASQEFSLTLDPTTLGALSITSTSLQPVLLQNLSYEITYYDGVSGGIIGQGRDISLQQVVNKASVSHPIVSAGFVGEAMGKVEIVRSYNTGSIMSDQMAASFLGLIHEVTASDRVLVDQSYSSGEVTALSSNGFFGNIYDNMGAVTVQRSFTTSNTLYAIASIDQSTVMVQQSYAVSSLAIGQGTTTGSFSAIDFATLANKTFLETTLGYASFVDEEHLDLDPSCVFVYENGALPILYFDDLLNPVATIHVGSYSFQNLSFDLDTVKFTSPITFQLEAATDLHPIQEFSYYLSSKLLTRSEIEAITTWIPYQDLETIENDGAYILYVKAVDYEGEVYYLNTDILLLDSTPAQIAISMGNNTWNSFHSIENIVSIVEQTSISLTALDDLSPVQGIYYYFNSEELSQEELEALGDEEWTVYESPILLDEEGQYILYVKVVDAYQDVTYANTDRIVFAGYQQTSLTPGMIGVDYGDNLNISDQSSISLRTTFDGEVFGTTDYEHQVRSNILLPVGTKITLIDHQQEKVYTYTISSALDLYHYADSCDVSDPDCEPVASYPFSLFEEVGKSTSSSFEESTSSTLQDDFTVRLDFAGTDLLVPYENVFVEVVVTDQNSNVLVGTLEETKKLFQIYPVDSALSIANTSPLSTILYNSDSTTSIDLVSTLNYGTNGSSFVLDTTYENQKLGFMIALFDQSGQIVEKENLNNITFKVGEQVYHPDEDGWVRIPLGDFQALYEGNLQILTSSSQVRLPNGTYAFHIYSYASRDGLYQNVLSQNYVSVPVVADSTMVANYSFDVLMDDADRLLIKDGEVQAMEFQGLVKIALPNPNIRVSLYRKQNFTAYDQEYTLIDLQDYVSDSLEEVQSNVYYAVKNPILYDGTSATYNPFALHFMTDKLDSGGYQLVFELFHDNEKVGTIEKKFIVK